MAATATPATKALGAGGVDQRAARHLSDQRDETGGGEDEADIDLCPFLRCEKDRDERSEAGLHVGDKKDEPVEATQTARRRRERRFVSVRRFAAASAGGCPGETAVLISTVAKAA